ncbi:hypothetical protein BDV36DRAFT_76522 [Aspergillus pseudocaelatus]|uniref:Uncharacterized protein n=1 Tax=Aspergillus pseudocaelatus TaxID=1825620 RepID=A0ABQ6W8N2_9EURO|nr:hypothetical protein BDV36DRAFT_76522 [Aspergillus pseudocaelatus]
MCRLCKFQPLFHIVFLISTPTSTENCVNEAKVGQRTGGMSKPHAKFDTLPKQRFSELSAPPKAWEFDSKPDEGMKIS